MLSWRGDVLSWRSDVLNCFTQTENTATTRQLISKRSNCWNAASLTTGERQHGASSLGEQLSLHSYWNPLSSFFGDTPQVCQISLDPTVVIHRRCCPSLCSVWRRCKLLEG